MENSRIAPKNLVLTKVGVNIVVITAINGDEVFKVFSAPHDA